MFHLFHSFHVVSVYSGRHSDSCYFRICAHSWYFRPPHLHSTTSKVMVIVWRLRGNIIRTVLYIANVLPPMGTVNKNSSHSPVGPWVCPCVCFLVCMIHLYVGVCFVLPWTVESFPFMFWRWRNKLKWAPFELFAPFSLLRVGSWPLWTKSNARPGGYLCRWSSTTE